jgi:outer membrane protein insertion porin family
VDPDQPLGPTDTGVHLLVRVVEAPDTTFAFGGGVEAGRKARSAFGGGYEYRLEFAPRGQFEVSRRNLGGRNRTIDFAGRVTLRPRDVPNDPVRDGRGYTFSEYRAALSYRERRAFRTDTDWLFTLTSEQAIRTTFNFVRNAGNVDFLRRLTARTTANLGYTIDYTRLFDTRFATDQVDQTLPIDRAFPQVRLSTFTFTVLTDRRDDAVAPKRGVLGTMELDIAGRAIGSEVGYMKGFFQGSTYRKLNSSGRLVLATRGVLGIARGFERPATVTLDDGTVINTTVADLPAAIRFFAGGSTTVRGFQLDLLGTPEVLTVDGLSLGGNGMVIGNAELRTDVGKLFGRKFTVVEFVDTGNVFAKASDISLARLRAAVGYGFRYDSPVGPIRVDFGYKLSQMTFVNGKREGLWEYHISFGEVF